MKFNIRNGAIALMLMVAVLAALMATNSPANIAAQTASCGINGCVSTPPLSSTTSYSYSYTSTSVIRTTSSSISTSISSSTTATTATTTSTSWSYTSTISTTLTTTSFSTVYTATQGTSNTFSSTLQSTSTSTATFTNIVTQKGVTGTSCPVSLVTNGYRLQPYAEFLRNFRNNQIQNTTAGRTFLTTFNSWYYSWAPTVAYSAATNPYAYTVVQATVVPLLGILYASYYSYGFVAPLSSEAAAITAGLVAASLIGLIYLAPIAYVASRIIRRHSYITRRVLGPSAAWFAAGVIMAFTAYATGSLSLLAFATTSLILSTLSLATLTSTRLLMCIQLPSVNTANLALLVRRFARTIP
ncbi:MAG: hypothetical protein ACLP5V_12950 [Candidatus Bathyarchaeia archaeon]